MIDQIAGDMLIRNYQYIPAIFYFYERGGFATRIIQFDKEDVFKHKR